MRVPKDGPHSRLFFRELAIFLYGGRAKHIGILKTIFLSPDIKDERTNAPPVQTKPGAS
jgi:hypothetical protein